VDAGDVAAAAARALTEDGHEGRAYALTGPESLSGAELAERLGEALGRPVRYDDVPPEALARALRAGGMGEWLVEALLEVMSRIREDASAPTADGVDRLCGRRPRSIGDFVNDHAAAFGAAATTTVGR
jgi:uncharacterized protein YbjT (DUF2867 family)